MRRITRLGLPLGLLASCVLTSAISRTSTPATRPADTSQDDIHRLTLPQIDPALAPGEGQNIVLVQCGVCHTPHYIFNQPPFSRKVWTAEVTKMRTTYGAPISDKDAAKIVDYLVAVHGSEDK